MAAPLGLGKPNQLINRIYQTTKLKPQSSLKIFTALSLEPPRAKNPHDLEGRLLNPFVDRYFGKDYPSLEYVKDLKKNQVPNNITVHEFYFQAGKYLSVPNQQQNYISINYTHAIPVIFDMNINILVQLIATSPDGSKYSLSCNPDLSLDLKDYYKKHNKPLMIVGVVHPDLPFLGGDAEVPEDFFDAVVISPEVSYKLFAVPRTEVEEADHLIGFHASQLVHDDGTLQIGIGSLGDALVHSTIFRHTKNDLYRSAVEKFWQGREKPREMPTNFEAFDKGLYATSEMLMDGFMHLRQAGLLKRIIFDFDEKKKRYMHGAFYLGSADFYQWLRELNGEDFEGLSMTRVSKVNDLYDHNELALRRQRKNARFFNTCMNVTLLGGAASETLEDGKVISGVGGQYNFVSMAHELADAHSVLMLRSARMSEGKRVSNIVWSHGHLTIPRHLRDIVVTEYGIAFLRGQDDQEVIKRLLAIADSEFQEELMKLAKGYGKLAADYELPEVYKNNTPKSLAEFTKPFRGAGFFAAFPFGNDFTVPENKIYSALQFLKKKSKAEILFLLLAPLPSNAKSFKEELARMKLAQPRGLKERVFRRLLLHGLCETALG